MNRPYVNEYYPVNMVGHDDKGVDRGMRIPFSDLLPSGPNQISHFIYFHFSLYNFPK